MGNTGESVNHGEPDRNRDAGEEAEPGRISDQRDRRGGESGAQHLAFETDIDDPRTLGEHAGERDQDERRRNPEHGVDHEHEESDGVSHDRFYSAAGAKRGRRVNRASIRGRNIFSKAPEKRMTRPWITTTISRLILGMSKARSFPPW